MKTNLFHALWRKAKGLGFPFQDTEKCSVCNREADYILGTVHIYHVFSQDKREPISVCQWHTNSDNLGLVWDCFSGEFVKVIWAASTTFDYIRQGVLYSCLTVRFTFFLIQHCFYYTVYGFRYILYCVGLK